MPQAEESHLLDSVMGVRQPTCGGSRRQSTEPRPRARRHIGPICHRVLHASLDVAAESGPHGQQAGLSLWPISAWSVRRGRPRGRVGAASAITHYQHPADEVEVNTRVGIDKSVAIDAMGKD